MYLRTTASRFNLQVFWKGLSRVVLGSGWEDEKSGTTREEKMGGKA